VENQLKWQSFSKRWENRRINQLPALYPDRAIRVFLFFAYSCVCCVQGTVGRHTVRAWPLRDHSPEQRPTVSCEREIVRI